jgi:uncharacterized protein
MRSTGHPGHQGTAGDGRASVDAPELTGPSGPSAGAGGPSGRPSGGPVGGPSAGAVLTRVVVAPIRLYRALSAARLPHCRYWPSCSAYAQESIEVHGVGYGLWLAVRRISRCHPWAGFGADPVPPARARARQVTC